MSASASRLLAANDVRPVVRMSELAPGLYPDIAAADYHARELGVASNTALDKIAQAPSVYKHWVSGGDDDEADTPALFFGKAFHCAVLEPDVFASSYAVEPTFGYLLKHDGSGTTAEQGKANRERRDAWRKENAGKTWLTVQDGKTLAGMAASVRAHPLAGRLLRSAGQNEITCRWRDAETGLACKARSDRWLAKLRTMMDLKSTDDPRPSAFRRSCEQYGYDRQESFYREGFAAVGEPIDDFALVAVSKAAPHLVAVYTQAASSVYEAQAQNRQSLRTLAKCLATGEWPGLPIAIQELELRSWRLAR